MKAFKRQEFHYLLNQYLIIKQNLKEHYFQVILTSPEMCLLDTAFHPILTSESFSNTVLCYVIDEAHCISQWGSNFWQSYGLLDQLRAFVPTGVPILATSATLNPKALEDVILCLKINFNTAFYINLGNDHPNMTYSTRTINSFTDLSSLNFFFLWIWTM